jgi:hypothetical protein
VPPVQTPKPLCVQEKEQLLKSASVWIVAGSVESAVQFELSTVVPSERVQETLRVCVAVLEQVFEEALHAPVVQLKVQPLKSATVCEVAGSVPVQKLLATVTLSLRTQVTLRVCASVAVQEVPVAGVQEAAVHT